MLTAISNCSLYEGGALGGVETRDLTCLGCPKEEGSRDLILERIRRASVAVLARERKRLISWARLRAQS